MTLFRAESTAARRQPHIGTIVLPARRTAWWLCGGVAAFVSALAVLIVAGEYTRRATVPGYVVPQAGVLRVHPPMNGLVAELAVREGDLVHAGQALATIVDERVGPGGTDARAAALQQIESRQAGLRLSIEQQTHLFAQQRAGLQARMRALEAELSQLGQERETQQRRLVLATENETRFAELHRQGYVSPAMAQERSEVSLEHTARLQAIERAQVALRRELQSTRAELDALPLRERQQHNELDRAWAQLEQERIDASARRMVMVTAPQVGRVSGLTAKSGQAATVERPLLTLIPADAAMEVHLFAPSRDVGFVRTGQAVRIRYNAYPYQKFGHYRGSVTEVTRTPLSASELPYPVLPRADRTGALAALMQPVAAEPVFRVTVALDQPHVRAYGRPEPLHPGMQLEADIMLDRRTLAEWMLEPLYSLRGKYLP